MTGPILHGAIVKRDISSFVTSLPGTHWVQEFLITLGWSAYKFTDISVKPVYFFLNIGYWQKFVKIG